MRIHRLSPPGLSPPGQLSSPDLPSPGPSLGPSHGRRQRGFSIIELMVAMVIATILLAGTAGLFVSNKRIYREQDESAILQENGRFAIQILYDSLRMAGFVGCHNDPSQVFNQAAPPGQSDYIGKAFKRFEDGSPVYERGHTLEGFEEGVMDEWAPSDSDEVTRYIREGTDAITIRYFRDTGIRLQVPMRFASDPVDLPNYPDVDLAREDIGVNSHVAVSNCSRADIFQITGIGRPSNRLSHSQAGGNRSNSLSTVYSTTASLSKVVTRRFYIGNIDDDEEKPALFCAGGDDLDKLCKDNGMMLVEGVEDMQILYELSYDEGDKREGKILDDADPDNIKLDMLRLYRSAGDTEDVKDKDAKKDEFGDRQSFAWDKVIGVKIAVLVRTPSKTKNTNKYYLLDKEVGPFNDEFRRRVFTTHVLVRNRRS